MHGREYGERASAIGGLITRVPIGRLVAWAEIGFGSIKVLGLPMCSACFATPTPFRFHSTSPIPPSSSRYFGTTATPFDSFTTADVHIRRRDTRVNHLVTLLHCCIPSPPSG